MKNLTQFEKDCIRLSILYALNGDSSVPSSHAIHIAKYVYPKLLANGDFDEMELLSKTINARLKTILKNTVSFEVKPNGQPVNDLIHFMVDYDVKSLAELLHFDRIWFDDELGKYTYIRKKSLHLESHPHKYEITKFNLDGLIIWQNLSSLFESNNGKKFFYGWKINESDDGLSFENVKLTFNSKSKSICYLDETK